MSIARRLAATALALASAAAALAPGAALATSFQFDGEAVRSNSNTALTPSIRVGLHAMASERGIEQRMETDEAGHPVVIALSRTGSYFTLLMGVKDQTTGTPLRILPPGPCRRVECMERSSINFIALAADGTPILVQATVSSPDGRLDPGSIYSFVPQPEPPGDFGAAMRTDFRLLTDSPSPEVSVTLTVVGPAGSMVLE